MSWYAAETGRRASDECLHGRTGQGSLHKGLLLPACPFFYLLFSTHSRSFFFFFFFFFYFKYLCVHFHLLGFFFCDFFIYYYFSRCFFSVVLLRSGFRVCWEGRNFSCCWDCWRRCSVSSCSCREQTTTGCESGQCWRRWWRGKARQETTHAVQRT